MSSAGSAPSHNSPEKWSALFSGMLSPEAVIRTGEPLARRTTMRVGGPADVYVEPASEADLAQVLRICGEHDIPWLVLGRGSNVLFRDGGYAGVVISLSQSAFARIEVAAPEINCGAGARLKDVAYQAKAAGLSGFEFMEGIPGTVGGGLRMNAGAMGGAMFDLVSLVRLMGPDGQVRGCLPAQMKVEYRRCATLKDHVAISTVLRGEPAAREEIEQRMDAFNRKRWGSQPALPSAGCMFKNPRDVSAGKLIDELGLKGTRVGGAVVSLKHGNFIVNEGNATAQDVCRLIELIRERALVERGVELDPEVEIVGRE